jgi:hypothetical protein
MKTDHDSSALLCSALLCSVLLLVLFCLTYRSSTSKRWTARSEWCCQS